MTSRRSPPTGWTLESERTVYDELMGRDYTTVLYRQEDTRSAVYINEVIDGSNVWEYAVHRSGRDGDLGTTTDLETAKQIAFEFMNDTVDSV
jgi:hypothetical protein